MGKIYSGSSLVKKAFYGSTEIKKIYYGSTLVYQSAPQRTATITSGTYANCFLSTSSTATSGSSTLTVDNGTTVYAFVKLTQSVSTGYIYRTWVLVSGTNGASGAVYRVNSRTMNSNWDFGVYHARTLKTPIVRADSQEGDFIVLNENGVTVTATINYWYESSTDSNGDETDVTIAANRTYDILGLMLGGSLSDYLYASATVYFNASGFNTSDEDYDEYNG